VESESINVTPWPVHHHSTCTTIDKHRFLTDSNSSIVFSLKSNQISLVYIHIFSCCYCGCSHLFSSALWYRFGLGQKGNQQWVDDCYNVVWLIILQGTECPSVPMGLYTFCTCKATQMGILRKVLQWLRYRCPTQLWTSTSLLYDKQIWDQVALITQQWKCWE
jgi:hypothetical protein